LYEAAANDPDDQISEASGTLLDALAGGTVAAIDRPYWRSVGQRLGMPLPQSTA
jgi:hypothetical protein